VSDKKKDDINPDGPDITRRDFVGGALLGTGSMLLVVIANAGIYLDNATLALPSNTAPLAVQALGYGALAMALVIGDRGVWREARMVGASPSGSSSTAAPPRTHAG